MAELKPKGGLKPGTPVVIGGVTYTAPQLNFGAMRAMREIPRDTLSYTDDLMSFVLMQSLARNYDGVDAMWLNDTLEGSEMDGAGIAFLAILKASGLKAPEIPEPGEAGAVTG